MNEVVIGLVIIYALPVVIAFGRGHPHRGAIAALAILFGWSFIGWAIAIIWSLTGFDRRAAEAPTPAPDDPDPGGERIELEIEPDRASGSNVVGLRPRRRRPF